MKQAYYSADLSQFLITTPQEILGQLASGHTHDLNQLQRNAWLAQVELLQRELKSCSAGWIAFEFIIPRMGKRVDVILIRKNVVFVIEFKVGAESYEGSALDQVNDYSLDLKNFHEGSHHCPVVPLLIATNAEPEDRKYTWYADGLALFALSNGRNLAELLDKFEDCAPQKEPIEARSWASSGYKPTPTIIEAAQALYAGHRVEEITRSDASAINLTKTALALEQIIERSKRKKERAICFVTGVPGAGKTLAGLNLVAKRTKADKNEHAVFLSGNGPLVDVLREALAQDEHRRAEEADAPISLASARRKVMPFIQNIHHFRDEYLRNPKEPIERVTVFDEAQRAWGQDQLSSFMKKKDGLENFNKSEPELLIEVMNRHENWCTIVCLIGGGQEINSGEAGLTEWFHAIKERFNDWKVYTSPIMAHPDYHWGKDLSTYLTHVDNTVLEDLHLNVSVRSFRAERLSAFVGALIAGNHQEAKTHFEVIKARYPIFLTRDLSTAKSWLNHNARGSERIGLVASSKAVRLKAQGLNVKVEIEPADWFLKPRTDVRSSYYLEDLATEFQIQGLELDWTAVCWEGNLRWSANKWQHFEFKGTTWRALNDPARQAYLANSYRVLLTRARQGMIIYIPVGDEKDHTRRSEYYEGTYAYLKQCGLPDIG